MAAADLPPPTGLQTLDHSWFFQSCQTIPQRPCISSGTSTVDQLHFCLQVDNRTPVWCEEKAGRLLKLLRLARGWRSPDMEQTYKADQTEAGTLHLVEDSFIL